MSVTIRLAQSVADHHAWNDFVLHHPGTSFYNITHWLNSYSNFGIQPDYLIAEQEGQIVAGASLAVYRAGPISWVQIPHGPVIDPARPELTAQLLSAIDDYARDNGCIFIQIAPFAITPNIDEMAHKAEASRLDYSADILPQPNAELLATLSERGFQAIESKIKLLTIPREGQIVDLREDDIIMGFRKGTRRDIRYTIKSDIRAEQVTTLDALQSAYAVLKANADEIGYDIRPWNSFRDAIWAGIENETALVMTAILAGEIVAVNVVLFGGDRGYYTLGGTTRIEDKRMFPAHYVQYMAMQAAKERGYTQYDLTSVVGGGVASFKRGFRPTYYQLAHPVIKVYRPALFRLFTRAYPILYRNRRQIARLINRTKSIFNR
jgi:peptidoglycan pentaglycine glycine transferase (the first glycine)